jgi:hypothetical protein
MMGGLIEVISWVMGQPRTINLVLLDWVSPDELILIDDGWAEIINIHR